MVEVGYAKARIVHKFRSEAGTSSAEKSIGPDFQLL